jgi:hypothetical protein
MKLNTSKVLVFSLITILMLSACVPTQSTVNEANPSVQEMDQSESGQPEPAEPVAPPLELLMQPVDRYRYRIFQSG